MWRVTAIVEGTRRAVHDGVRVVEGEPPSIEQVRAAASGLPRSQRLLRYLDAEVATTSENPRVVRSFDAVQRWSADAALRRDDALDAPGSFVTPPEAEGALGYLASPASLESGVPDSVVWHAHSLVVVSIPPGVDELELEYQPDARDAARLQRLARYQTPAHAVEAVLDARTCRGGDSLLTDHFRAMRGRGQGVVTSVRGTADMLVGRVLYRITAVQPAPLTDLSYASRLAEMERQWPDLSRRCPDLGTLTGKHEHDAAMVFIHGTLSCGLQSLKDLFAVEPPPFPVYRYEHDTFLRAAANGRDLAARIAATIKAKHLLLVAHSRGGLVGRVTMAALQKAGVASTTELLTFGTPHHGTPLVRMAHGLLNLLVKVGAPVANGIPLLTPIAAACSLVYDVSSLPPGIAIMAEDSEVLDLLNDAPASAPVRAWGSAFDPDTRASGFGIDIENVLTGALAHVPHDLVVPRRSATAYGQQQPELTCSHAGYFAQREVRAAIVDTMTVLMPVPAKAARGDNWWPARAVFAVSHRLAVDSPLPAWFELPPGTSRELIFVFLRYSPDRTTAVMTLRGLTGGDRSVTCEVRRVEDDSQTKDYPRREILTTGGLTETIEYRAMGSAFRLVTAAPPAAQETAPA